MSAPILSRWNKNDSYGTPEFLRDALDHEFGLNYDPCPLSKNPELDGLSTDWTGRRVFVNPPWSDITPWVRKATASRAEIVVMVLPARTDTLWFHHLKDRGAEMRLFRRRVRFIRNDAQKSLVNATDGTMVAVVRPLASSQP